MRYTSAVLAAALTASVSAHGVVTEIQGANGVNMPGLSVADGTPRDCAQASCGSQADTAIVRQRDIASGRAGPLGRTTGSGPVDANAAVAMFMSGANGAATQAAKRNPYKPKPRRMMQIRQALASLIPKREPTLNERQLANLLGGLLGGGGAAGGAGGAAAGTATPQGTAEQGVSRAAGTGAQSGLPTAAEDGTVTMTFHQINQDGAGPIEASVDGTSGGTDEAAFQTAQVTQDVPGLGFQGLSLATNMDFPLKVQMPQGMTCDGTAGGAQNVCVLRVFNGAGAGPFGGSVAFTQTAAQRKRALEYRAKVKRWNAKRSLMGDLQGLVDGGHEEAK